MVNWMPTVAGLLAAIGMGFVASGEQELHLIGVILSVVGTAMLGIVSKQFNVHGGTVAQATPAAIQAKMKEEGQELDCKKDPEKCK